MHDADEFEAHKYTPSRGKIEEVLAAQKRPRDDTLNEYLCEVCDKKQDLTEAEAYAQGWDYPPFMGMWGIVSPRTCGDCGIEATAYWQVLMHQGTPPEGFNDRHAATIIRIIAEKDNHAGA